MAEPTTLEDGPVGLETLAGRRLRLRLLAATLLGLWAGLGLALVVAYRPGGPLDRLVVLAFFLPVAVAALAVAWPPLLREPRPAAAVAALGVAAVLLVAPLLIEVVTTVASSGTRTLLPSAEGAYGGVMALATLCLYSSLGVLRERTGDRAWGRSDWVRGLGLGTLLTLGLALLLGGLALANGSSLEGGSPQTSRFGPTDPRLALPTCRDVPSLGSTATLSLRAHARIDGRPVGRAEIEGLRDGPDETWTGRWSGPAGGGSLAYDRRGAVTVLAGTGAGAAATSTGGPPDPFGLLGDDGLTVDGPVRAAIGAPASGPVVEDRGVEIVEGARARHCVALVDGPIALSLDLPLRWLSGGHPLVVSRGLEAWRGELEWWVFADGQLGRSVVTISGYPGDAWPDRSGVGAVLQAELAAVDRGRPVALESPTP